MRGDEARHARIAAFDGAAEGQFAGEEERPIEVSVERENGERDGGGVEVGRGVDLPGLDEHQRVVGRRIQLGFHGVSRVREGDRVAAANSAPCGECRPCLAQRPNLCEDLLFVNGAYGEYIALPPRLVAKNIVRLQRLTAARAAFAEPLACALLGIARARVETGQTLAVFGHGPLGCLLAMVAAAHKCRVIVVGKAGWRLDRVRALGIGECLDASATADVVADLRAVTDGRGPDVTIDATGRPEVWEQAMAAVGRGGSVVFFGGCAPGTTVQVDTRRAHYEELTLVGAFHHTPELIRQAVDALETGTIVPDGLLTHRMRLDGVHAALDLMQKGEALKVLIEP